MNGGGKNLGLKETDCWSSRGSPSGERVWAETWITKWTAGKQCSRRGNSKSGRIWERKAWWVQATQGEDSWNRVPDLGSQFPQAHSAAVRRDGVARLFLTFYVSPGRARGHIPRKCPTLWSCAHTNRCFYFLILTIIVNKNKVNGGHQNCAEYLLTCKDCVLLCKNLTERSPFLGSSRDFTKQCSEMVSLKTPVWSWCKSVGNAWGSNSVFLYYYFQMSKEAVHEQICKTYCNTINKESCLFLCYWCAYVWTHMWRKAAPWWSWLSPLHGWFQGPGSGHQALWQALTHGAILLT